MAPNALLVESPTNKRRLFFKQNPPVAKKISKHIFLTVSFSARL